ncbi:MAG TPA: murein L,D-transpeptidase family protein [Devosiaceae bacterium]|jgi:murein L,D-transpeptidase YafK
MTGPIRKIAAALLLLGVVMTLSACGGGFIGGNAKANKPLSQALVSRIAAIGSTPGAGMMVRIFKQDSQLEIWKQSSSGDYKLLTTYKICAWSGDLGPKVKEGDRQAPEGFYNITPALMNPNSGYYLSFNTGYPNKFDRSYGRTGSNLMVHGDCSSAGCYAMTDESIADIYALARESFRGGNKSVQLEIYPFRMTPENLAKVSTSPNMAFWKNIKQGYDQFELTHRPPTWDVCNRQYVFNANGPGGSPLDPTSVCPPLTRDPSLVAALEAKQASDELAYNNTVASITQKQQATADAAARQEAADASAKARGQALGSFFNNLGGGIFGGKTQPVASTPTDPTAVTAPVPETRG